MASKPTVTRHPPPEEGSIHSILVANPSNPLYLHPVAWKPEHFEHLSCKLHPLSLSLHEGTTNEVKKIPPFHGSNEWKEIRAAIAQIQRQCVDFKANHSQMCQLMIKLAKVATEFKPQRSGNLSFQYLNRTVAKIHLPLFFYHQQSAEDVAWAYIDQSWTLCLRFNFHDRYASAAKAVNRTSDLPIDPLYIAIMIALAQKLKSARLPGLSEVPKRISLFVPEHTSLPRADGEEIRPRHMRPVFVTSLKQYSASITDAYLLKLEDPQHFHDGSVHIHQRAFSVDGHKRSIAALCRTMREACGAPVACVGSGMESRREARKRNWRESGVVEGKVEGKRRTKERKKGRVEKAEMEGKGKGMVGNGGLEEKSG